jgi:hypothetical protein
VVRRETFASAVELGVDALKALGVEAAAAERSARMFREHDEQTLTDLYELWEKDHENYVVESRAKREELARLLKADDAGSENASADDATTGVSSGDAVQP